MTFKTQQEIWLHLAQGGAVQSKNFPQIVVRFNDGKLPELTFVFRDFEDWQPYIEPPKRVKRTFYRRKWALLDGEGLFNNYSYRPSKGAFDDYHGVGYRDTVWSDEWEEIVIEVQEETK